MKLYMLDTNTVSYVVKGVSHMARERLSTMSTDEVACVSTITEAELLYGLEKAGSGEQRRKSVDWLLGRLRILPWDREAAAAYGTLRAKQEQIGRVLGPLDTQIAAHAISIGAILVSSDKALLRVPSLPGVEDWAKDLHE